MNKSTMEAYAEVDEVLGLMNKKYVDLIPLKLRTLFKEKKSNDYIKEITANKSLKEQNLKKETLSILAVLNYHYWCKDEENKKQLIKLYAENEKKYQEEIREKYNPDNIFKKEKDKNLEENIIENEVALVEYKESRFSKLINKIKSIFARK